MTTSHPSSSLSCQTASCENEVDVGVVMISSLISQVHGIFWLISHLNTGHVLDWWDFKMRCKLRYVAGSRCIWKKINNNNIKRISHWRMPLGFYIFFLKFSYSFIFSYPQQGWCSPFTSARFCWSIEWKLLKWQNICIQLVNPDMGYLVTEDWNL